jgi:hypothetical protein
VTYNCDPVEGATIVFCPQDHAWAAATKSDADSRFRMKTLQANPNDGAAPGMFKVTVRKNYMTPQDVEIWQLPRPYGFVDRSTLTANVVDGQTNDFLFELVD